MAKWTLKQSSANIEELARQAGVSPVMARLFAVRGYRSAAAVQAFLHNDEQDLADPLLFRDMEQAVAAVVEAIAKQTPVAIYGDYDADGVASTVIMLKTLHYLGLTAQYYIPDRENEGYGMHNEAIANLAGQGIELLLACDNGISALEQIEYANSLGMQVVVFDHHDLATDESSGQQLLPAALAVVDAKRLDCPYPFKNYCAAAVCYRFAQAICQQMGREWQPLREEILPFAAIATVCDIVELTGENRLLVKAGLPAISRSADPGLNALLRQVELAETPLTVFHIGFVIGPCINASGRLEIADLAVDLFMTDSIEEAEALAARLAELNQTRRDLTENGAAQAFALIEEQHMAEDKVLVLYCPEVPESVMGIIAGRIKERYNRPAVMIGGSEKQLLRGSCRSVEGYNIFEALSQCRSILPSFGGHPLAAGLSVAEADIAELRKRLNEYCQLSWDDLQPTYRIDCPLPLPAADLKLARQIEALAPFGKGNEQPLFADKRLVLERVSLLGKKEQVLRWHLRHGSGSAFEAIDFSGKEKLQSYITAIFGSRAWSELCRGSLSEPLLLDIIYTLSVNVFNGRESARLTIVDFRAS